MLGFWILATVLTLGASPSMPPTAASIMARVAKNQDRSNGLRADYIYRQRIHVASRKSDGKLMCEERRGYLVIPSPDSTTKKLQVLSGRYWHKGRYVSFSKKLQGHDQSIDCGIVDSFAGDFTNEHSKDGIAKDLFPLTTEQQREDEFKLIGVTTLDGRKVYRIGFRPKKKHIAWAGEADIDTKYFQPVYVFTKLSHRLPFAVRTFLVALPGLGFNVQYQRQADGVWFPTSFGTEFRVKVLMFYHRTYTISLENSDFRRTDVSSNIRYAEPASPPK